MTSALYCPHCGGQISATDTFCSHCGKKIESTIPVSEASSPKQKTVACSQCGRVNPSSAVVCAGCGSELKSETVIVHQKETSVLSKKQKKKNGSTLSLTNYVVMSFFVLAALIIGVEYIGSPKPTMSSQTSTSQEEHTHTTDPAVLNAIKGLEAKITVNPNDSESLLQLANALHDAKFYPRAIEMYKKFIVLNPAHANARVDMAICYFETGDTPRAIAEIESVVKKEPKHQMALFNLGIIHLSSGNMDEAKRWLQKAADIDSTSPAGQRAKELLHQH